MNGRRRFGRVLGAAGVVMLVGALVMGPTIAQAKGGGGGGGGATVIDTLAGDEITSHNTPGWYEDCTPGGENDQGEWHWVITGIDPHPDLADAPQSITVSWSSGPDTVVNLSSVNGSMAHYYYFGHLDDGVYPTGATAVWPDGTDATDYNNFNLSHGQCSPPEDDPELTVEKTVEIEYDEYYLWEVDKQLVGTEAVDGGADVTYKAVVTRTGPFPVPGSYRVFGVIRVTNTGNVEVTITSVTDALTTLGSDCPVDDDSLTDDDDLNVGETMEFTYSCTFSGLPADNEDHTNTATAYFTFEEAEQEPADSDAMPVDYSTAELYEAFDKSATLSDDKYPGITPSSYDGSGESDEYTIFVAANEDNCEGFTNTATITGGTDDDDTFESDSDSVTVEVCPEEGSTTTQAPTTTQESTTSSVENLPPTESSEVLSEPPLPESGALPQTGWLGTNLTLLLGLAMLASGGLAIGFTRRSAKS